MTPDIPDAQVAMFYEDDPHFVSHVRVLLVRLDGCRGIVGTPTLSVEAVDLADFRVLPLLPKAEFPARIRRQVFFVNRITDQELDLLRGDAYALAMILGAPTSTAADPSVVTWHVSDPSHPHYRTLRDGLAEYRFHDPMTPASNDWPFTGPMAVKELIHAARGAGEELSGYHDHWVRASGVNADSPVAMKHRDLLTILSHMVSFEQLDMGQASSAEDSKYQDAFGMVSRLVLQIHHAVQMSPRAPDFRGTGLMVTSSLSGNGGALFGDFGKLVAEEQKAHVFTLEQQRLCAEESHKRTPGGGGGGSGGGGGGGGGNDPKKDKKGGKDE